MIGIGEVLSSFYDYIVTYAAVFVNNSTFYHAALPNANEWLSGSCIIMNLIEGFWKQLKLEGHKNDFLQDYRLALLDVMAHLCEMYRRSIPPDPPLTSHQAPR